MRPLVAIESAAIAIWAVFAPVRAVMMVTGTLIFVDLVTGMWAAKKANKPITSKGISRTLAKVALYECAIAVSYLVHQYMTGDLLPADKLVAGLIGLVELTSILENLNTINGSPIFAAIVNRAINAQDQIAPKDGPK